MTTKSTDKNSIKILNELLKKYSNKEEITQKYGIKSAAFFKHLTEIKQAGFNLLKDNSFYKIKAFCGTFDLTSADTSTIAHLYTLSYFMQSKKRTKNLETLLEKILLLSSNEKYNETLKKIELFQKTKNYMDYSSKISLFEEFINKNKITKVLTLSNNSYILKPSDIKRDKNNIYFHFYDEEKNENKTIPIEDIVKIIPIDESEDNIQYKKEIIFELYGRLIKSYRLKEDERLIEVHPEKIVIANSSSDKNILFKRLLRYDILCRVLFPISDAKEFQNLINNSLQKLKSGI